MNSHNARFASLLATTLLFASSCSPQATPAATAAPSPAPTVPPAPTRAPTAVPPTSVPLPTAVSDPGVLKLADAYLDPLQQQGKFGGAVMMVRDGKLLLNKGYGYADAQRKTLIETDTQFIVGMAMMSPLLAILALQLRDEGRLSLEESLCARAKPCDDRFMPITLRHLLANRSGIPDERYVPGSGLSGLATMGAFVTNLAKLPVERFAQPDQGFQTFALPQGVRVPAPFTNNQALYFMIRDAAGMEPILLSEVRLSIPAGIKSLGMYRAPTDRKSAIPGEPIDRASDKGPLLLMSAQDVNAFLQALFGTKYLSAKQLDEMLTPAGKAEGLSGDMSAGLGVLVGKDPTGRKVVSQLDTAPGYGAYWAYYPDDKLTVIVLNHVTDWANQPLRARDVGLELARQVMAAKCLRAGPIDGLLRASASPCSDALSAR